MSELTMNNALPEDEHASVAETGGHHHILSIRTYLNIFVTLLVLTYVTVQVSLLDLGDIAI